MLLGASTIGWWVSMESGLEGRNNQETTRTGEVALHLVSMESGLEGRNNRVEATYALPAVMGLNGDRPRRPVQ